MKQMRVLGFFSSALLLALVLTAGAKGAAIHELELGTATGSIGDIVSIPLTMDSPDENIQGVVSAFDWDGTKLAGTSLTAEAALALADTVVRRLMPSYAILGVVMDSDGTDGEVIPAGSGILLATLKLQILVSAAVPTDVPVEFRDTIYSMTDGGPTLDNIVVVGGLSIGATEGLTLTNGKVTIVPIPPTFEIVSLTVTDPAACPAATKVQVLMKNDAPVQGYVTAIAHTAVGAAPQLKLQSIDAGAAATGADFVQAEIFSGAGDIGGTLGVVMDLDAPFGSPLPIPAGSNEIALYGYCLASVIPCTPRGSPQTEYVYDLKFVDFALGDPLKENVIVVDGASINPELKDGTLTLKSEICPLPTEEKITFAVGGCTLVDDPNSDDKDIHIPGPITALRGTVENPGKFQVGLYYKSPPQALDPEDPEMPQTNDHIQGVSMAVKFDQNCITCDGTYDITGTITETVKAEFVNVLCENYPTADPLVDCAGEIDDGDAGELIVGIMVDALPPFDGADLPPTSDYLKLVCVDFHVNSSNDWDCETCKDTILHMPKPFVPDTMYGTDDGVDVVSVDPEGCAVRGETPLIRNLATVRSRVPDPLHPGEYITQQISVKPNLVDGSALGGIEIREEPIFIRGDCNWSDMGSDVPHTQAAVDISDAAAVVSYLFLDGTWHWEAPCLDACDANDDGRVDLADSVYILKYLYKFGSAPTAPFPNFGVDPTNDRLDCAGAWSCNEGTPWTPDP